ncbi:hypothetical protein ABTZ58_00555 [Streptomyces sp. NPDC094143]|uniref:hypothetical protein n=1 Tax=Streptomyces sp. NPDC094143 TaxID=3155310 RepID=UPI00331F3D01
MTLFGRGPGEPTGILREAAQRLAQEGMHPPTIAERRRAIRGVIAELRAPGITGYTEPGLAPTAAAPCSVALTPRTGPPAPTSPGAVGTPVTVQTGELT